LGAMVRNARTKTRDYSQEVRSTFALESKSIWRNINIIQNLHWLEFWKHWWASLVCNVICTYSCSWYVAFAHFAQTVTCPSPKLLLTSVCRSHTEECYQRDGRLKDGFSR
jgi:hypothetical protein